MNKPQKPKSLGKLAVLQQQVDELTKALQHERADAENLRRRHEEQISGLRDMVKASVVRDILPALDNVDRALEHVPRAQSSKLTADSSQLKTWEDWAKGVVAIKAQFYKVLQDIAVERIKTVGEVFDPHLHEAVHMEDGKGSVEVVCEELQPGYKLGDDVIRHAIVKVKMEQRK